MINAIFLDLDECILHSLWPSEDCDQEHLQIIMDENGERYNTIIHPQAQDIINYSRLLVGADNVFILTSAIKRYALQINEKANFGFAKENVIAREDFMSPIRIAYGEQWATHKQYNKNNVLIDNLSYCCNPIKTAYIGIGPDRYLKVRDYYGVNFPEDNFYLDVSSFLSQKLNEPTQ